jgi:hypothetical protein
VYTSNCARSAVVPSFMTMSSLTFETPT